MREVVIALMGLSITLCLVGISLRIAAAAEKCAPAPTAVTNS